MPRTPEQVREAKRLSMAKRRAENPDATREYNRKFHAANRERQTATMRAYYAKRFFWGKAMKLRQADRASYKELAQIWKKQRGRCALTGRRLDRTAHLDHIVAKARGGGDAASNLRWVCPEVNLARRDLDDQEFLLLCQNVMQWIGERIALVEGL